MVATNIDIPHRKTETNQSVADIPELSLRVSKPWHWERERERKRGRESEQEGRHCVSITKNWVWKSKWHRLYQNWVTWIASVKCSRASTLIFLYLIICSQLIHSLTKSISEHLLSVILHHPKSFKNWLDSWEGEVMVAGCEHVLSKYHKREEVNWHQRVNISFWLNAT